MISPKDLLDDAVQNETDFGATLLNREPHKAELTKDGVRIVITVNDEGTIQRRLGGPPIT